MPWILTASLFAALLSASALADDQPWRVFYDGSFKLQPSGAWTGPQTRSERTAQGLHIVDPSAERGSGRLYYFDWQVKPGQGATVEARLKVARASEAWGACVNVADGRHEEDVSFFPDRVMLSHADLAVPFPGGDAFHTYRITFKAPDITVWADGKLLIDGRGKFAREVLVPARNRVAFGSSSSRATSDSTWQSVRFQGGEVHVAEVTQPSVPGIEVRQGETRSITPDARFLNMFQFANGMLQVGGKRSTDGGDTWLDAPGPWVGACQLADGEVIALDYRTHAAAQKGWYTSALRRWDAQGKPLPTLRARLHVPEFVTTMDDDGSKRDGPWCDHAIVQLHDGSLLAACSGCFREDSTPIPTYHPEWGAKKYRGFVCRSTDRGLTWEVLSTVTADPTLGAEGCNEMDLIRAPNGDLLCLFRTGGNRRKPDPLYQCRSSDEGRTWGPPERVADRGVWPNTCLLECGILVCTYGRPGNWLTFSLDSGRTWVGHFCFYAGNTTSYNSVEEVAPGKILVMYDRSGLGPGGNAKRDVVGALFSVRRLLAVEETPGMNAIDIGTSKHLFIDRHLIERSDGVTLVLNPPVKRGPIALSGPVISYVSVVEHAGKCFMYYLTTGGYGVATSEDGVTWESPGLSPSGKRGALALPGCTEGSVFVDPKCTDGYAFKGIFGLSRNSSWGRDLVPPIRQFPRPGAKPGEEGALYLFRSKDGLRWECVPKIAVPFACDTHNQCFYDARLDRYVAYLRGFPEQEGARHRFKRVVVRTEIRDLMDMPWPFRRNASRATGPGGCYGYIHDEMDIVLAADERDAPKTDLYSPCAHAYPESPNVYVAFPCLFRTYGYGTIEDSHGRDVRGETSGDGMLEVHLAVSRDGVHFHRFRTPYLRPGLIRDRRGAEGDLDCGHAFMGIGIVRRGDELYQYYVGGRRTHVGTRVAESKGIRGEAVFRTVQRLDGFVSADAGPEGGEIVTRPVVFAGDRLTLNADCGGQGEIWVELQDAAGAPITGYSLPDAVSIDRNGTAQEVWWKSGPDVGRLAGTPVRLRLKMRSAKLYAFHFVQSDDPPGGR